MHAVYARVKGFWVQLSAVPEVRVILGHKYSRQTCSCKAVVLYPCTKLCRDIWPSQSHIPAANIIKAVIVIWVYRSEWLEHYIMTQTCPSITPRLSCAALSPLASVSGWTAQFTLAFLSQTYAIVECFVNAAAWDKDEVAGITGY